jgi:glucokinase
MAIHAVNDSTFAVGVDIGGQSVKLALVDGAGLITLRRNAPIDPRQPADAITHLILDEARAVLDEARGRACSPAAVGVVMPGYMDRERTRLLMAANLPTLGGSNLLAEIRAALPLPVLFDADCNAAAFGEYRFGAGRGVDRLIVATVGTGIGAGVVLGGQILRTRGHIAGSLGHVIVDPKGPTCPCGARGCLEAHASGVALEAAAAAAADAEPASMLARLRSERGRLSGLEIGIAAGQGDPAAERVVRECGWWLGVGIASWSVVFDPQKVLIGGGVSRLGEPLLAAMREGFQEVAQPHLARQVEIGLAALGPDAGVIGAAALAMSS